MKWRGTRGGRKGMNPAGACSGSPNLQVLLAKLSYVG